MLTLILFLALILKPVTVNFPDEMHVIVQLPSKYTGANQNVVCAAHTS